MTIREPDIPENQKKSVSTKHHFHFVGAEAIDDVHYEAATYEVLAEMEEDILPLIRDAARQKAVDAEKKKASEAEARAQEIKEIV